VAAIESARQIPRVDTALDRISEMSASRRRKFDQFTDIGADVDSGAAIWRKIEDVASAGKRFQTTNLVFASRMSAIRRQDS
jgi:hypothetical protein